MTDNIFYRSGYKYQLQADYSVMTGIRPEWDIVSDFYSIEQSGLVTVVSGYCWDGATKALDSLDFMRGALIHDIGCQAIIEGRLPYEFKGAVDRELIKICDKDGMSKMRQWYVYKAVDKFSCTQKNPHPLCSAPDKEAVHVANEGVS